MHEAREDRAEAENPQLQLQPLAQRLSDLLDRSNEANGKDNEENSNAYADEHRYQSPCEHRCAVSHVRKPPLFDGPALRQTRSFSFNRSIGRG